MNTYWKHALIRFFLWNEFITLIDCTSAAWVRKVKVLHKQREDYVRCSPDIPCCRTLPPGPVSFFLLSCFFFLEQSNTFFSDTTWTPDREDNREDNYLLWDRSQFQFPERPSHSGRCSTPWSQSSARSAAVARPPGFCWVLVRVSIKEALWPGRVTSWPSLLLRSARSKYWRVKI